MWFLLVPGNLCFCHYGLVESRFFFSASVPLLLPTVKCSLNGPRLIFNSFQSDQILQRFNLLQKTQVFSHAKSILFLPYMHNRTK